MTSVMWFRRDLRLADNPALLAALAGAADTQVVPLFVLDPALSRPAGAARRAYLEASLTDLGMRGGGLHLRRGDPVREVVEVARAAHASTVHVAEDFGPHGRQRDLDVEAELARHGISLVRTGSPYAVEPGRVVNKTGGHYQVFTPYSRAWRDHGWRTPLEPPRAVQWVRPLTNHQPDDIPTPAGLRLATAGESAARRRWRDFLQRHLSDYANTRDRPDLEGTSRMSTHLKWGEIHPRTMLADLALHPGAGAATYTTELAWREFYADVLWRSPGSARNYLNPEFAQIEYDRPGIRLTSWCDGLTGYPIVDAGMRQLRSEGWMHNRVRMIVASFLVKDLHIEWRHGARHFMRWLVDGDLASNQHGWQWAAGCGTDASPYFRIFSPTLQGKRFDPHGDYVRRYVPELCQVDEKSIHEPWALDGGPPGGYPPPIVDHDRGRVSTG
ncbi:MAG: deoxyribodipyrimidine photo-lyase, partial [Actinobacteria bacterium]|nr:deoxyribodipyrimidine photo-lyase [Actinomycetota bacterium]